MEQTYEDEQCAVFDEVLPEEQMQAIFEYLRQVDFRQVHEAREQLEPKLQQGYKRVWRHDEGQALMGPSFAALAWAGDPLPDFLLELAQRWSRRHQTVFYRSGTPVDFFLALLKGLAVERLAEWVGPANDGWIALTATPYLHPPGVGMSWHADARLYTGAFSFFVHPAWEPDFGGELLVAAKGTGAAWDNRAADPLSHRFPDHGDGAGQAAVDGRFFAPRPNRLVVLGRGVLHRVNRVSPLAGSRVRTALSGFFVDAEAVQGNAA